MEIAFWTVVGVTGYFMMWFVTSCLVVLYDRADAQAKGWESVREKDLDFDSWIGIMWPIALPVSALMWTAKGFRAYLNHIAIPPAERKERRHLAIQEQTAQLEKELKKLRKDQDS